MENPLFKIGEIVILKEDNISTDRTFSTQAQIVSAYYNDTNETDLDEGEMNGWTYEVKTEDYRNVSEGHDDKPTILYYVVWEKENDLIKIK